ncbi:NADPH-dependent 2,4-dienoyl-CoA reductase/sulfur reductase-like enzyme [Nonomuraea thailandensis]|uniref:NADPH-dependent 2,4-dienoyl-CoA reductase/sulfur reductase-like enzyme n=1 Tax=Nonomuraea thailandensis TaxID=1188745 RepID=A0A9X2GLQ0_9ACTN|nr:FAD-dependent oxidoreductase [Nonomuraea thailandensis]MCP2360012.1 NADPH-dependent 2,4-dienoyl-CoA reductase/sulfur reductase-like enzyme [Nonomuraea thailandensis]
MKVVIVGGGIAGVSTAAALRAGGFDGDLTLVDAGEFPYDRPPLSKEYLAGSKDSKQIALQPPHWYDEQRVRLLSRTKVTALRTRDGGVELADGTLVPADRVVLATGGGAARPPIPGAGSDRVHVLRTVRDADRLRAALTPGARVLVVGAGLIGAEVASTCVDFGCEVVLVDPAATPLTAALGAELAAWVHALHDARGVTVKRTGVAAFADAPRGIKATFLTSLEPQEFDLAVLGVGMLPSTSLAATAGLEVDRGIVVDAHQVTSNPAVLAVGDPARMRRKGLLLPRAEHWEAAQHDGARAAATILGIRPPAPTAPWFWTDRHGCHIEAVGHMEAAEQIVVRGSFDHPAFSVFGLRDGWVVAAAAVDDSIAVRAARRMIDRRIPADPDRLSDPSVNLRTLLRA